MTAPESALAGRPDRVARLERELAAYRTWVPPGHYYSPLPDRKMIRAKAEQIFAPPPRTLPGLDLREDGQLALLTDLAKFYPEMPFTAVAQPGLRYRLDNPHYAYADGVFLYGMLRHLRPARLIEIGCGHSSALIMDVNERFLGGRLRFTCIDPHPELLFSLISDADRAGLNVLARGLQQVDRAVFAELRENDILFIDSTHVSKIDSDVNHQLFEILPALAPGVVVHVHDIFYPFEYPAEWIDEGRAWNEAYLWRGFLQYNRAFSIMLMNGFLQRFHADRLQREMPLALAHPGSALWVRRNQEETR